MDNLDTQQINKLKLFSKKYKERTKKLKNEELLKIGNKSINEVEVNTPEWKAWLHHSAPSVYIIRCDKYFKIGVTNQSIISRLTALQTGNPYPLELVFSVSVKNIEDVEKRLHEKFKHKNIRGEWFELDQEDFRDIELFVMNLWK